MRASLRILLQAALFATVAGCAGPAPVAYHTEKFESTAIYSRQFPVPVETACEAVRRTLLSQGYIVNTATATQVDGRKSFQPEPDVHVEIAFRVVCTADGVDGDKSSIFVTALEDRYALKKVNNSATLGVGALGSVSLPFSSSDDSMVRVASETIKKEEFYTRFFQLVGRYLGSDAIPVSKTPMGMLR
jgi:hypothetical protein